MALAKPGGDMQHIGRCRPCAERAQVRVLDRGPIGHGIGERHAQLDHIRAPLDQRVEIGRGVAIACGEEADEGRVGFGEGVGEAGHRK